MNPPMTTPADEMRALAARCEAAKGADREQERSLILQAWDACFPAPGSPWRAGVGFNADWHAWNGRKARVRHWLAAGAFLDAAMTLKPSWALPNMRHDSDAMRMFCQLENGLGRPFKGYAAHGETLALALVAACLKAQAEQEASTHDRARASLMENAGG